MRRIRPGTAFQPGAFCRVVEDADPYDGDAMRQTKLVGAGVLDSPRGANCNQYKYGGEFAPFGRIRLHLFLLLDLLLQRVKLRRGEEFAQRHVQTVAELFDRDDG